MSTKRVVNKVKSKNAKKAGSASGITKPSATGSYMRTATPRASTNGSYMRTATPRASVVQAGKLGNTKKATSLTKRNEKY